MGEKPEYSNGSHILNKEAVDNLLRRMRRPPLGLLLISSKMLTFKQQRNRYSKGIFDPHIKKHNNQWKLPILDLIKEKI